MTVAFNIHTEARYQIHTYREKTIARLYSEVMARIGALALLTMTCERNDKNNNHEASPPVSFS